MQNIFGIISNNRNLQSYINKNSASHKYTNSYAENGIAYNFDINERCSFRECFYISKNVHVLVAGDVINKDFLDNIISSIKEKITDDAYAVCKDCLLQSLNKIEGIFCIVIFDVQNQKICILSETNGIIPVYYFHSKTNFIFATSIKQILSAQKRQMSLNYNAVYEIFKIGFIQPPDTLFKEINALLPGTVLEFDGKIHLFNPPKKEQTFISMNIEEAADYYFTLFEKSVLNRVSQEEKTALLLSGGVDSAAIAAILHKHKIPITCYTLDCNLEKPVEIIGAEKVCKLFNFKHISVSQFDKDIIPALNDVIRLNEAPIFNGIMEYAISDMIEKDTKIVITGDGNDLIWSIFPSHLKNHLQNDNLFSNLYLKIRSLLPDNLLDKLLLFSIEPQNLCSKIDALYHNTGDFLLDAAKADIKIFGDSYAFTSLGKLKMKTNSFNFKFPYLDYQIESLISSLPENFKHNSNNNLPFINKYLFKFALEQKQLLPKEIIHTQKTWMYSPNAVWLRSCLKKDFENIVIDNSDFVKEVFNINVIKQLWKLHIEQKQDFSFILMMVMQFELWYKIFSE